MEKFSLQHTVLYAKGWYKRYNAKSERKTIWDDLVIVLEMDGYLGTFEGDTPEQIKHRAAYLLVNQFQRLPNKGYANSLAAFFEGIKPYNCWKHGYYTKQYTFLRSQKEIDSSPDYDYDEAVARYVLSHLCSLEKGEWTPCAPDYTKLPRRNGISNEKLKNHFGDLDYNKTQLA